MRYSQKLRIAICDDIPAMLERLQQIVKDTLENDWELEFVCASSTNTLLQEMGCVQIAILDIQMPEQSGIELAKEITAANPDTFIIFVSGYVQYVSDVYDVPHYCMVLKDYLTEHLPKYLLRAAQKCSEDSKKRVPLKIRGVEQYLDAASLCFLERRGHITYINFQNNQRAQTREKLSDLLERLNSTSLCRCHISYVVNLRYVHSMSNREFIMKSGEKIPISRANLPMVKNRYFQYLKEHL